VQDFSNLHMKLKTKPRVSLMLAIVFLLMAGICQAQSGWTASRISSGGKDLNTVYFADAKLGWIGGDSGFFSYTEDGGRSWIERPLGIDHAVNDIYFAGKVTGFALAGGSILETPDGGHSWREAHRFLPSEFDGATPELYSLRFNGKKRGWVVGSVSRGDVITNSILALTRDGGATWQLLQAPTRQELIHIDVVDEKRAWIVGAGGAILRTDDAGESWIKQVSDTTVTLFHVDFRNDKKGWAVGERGTILLTEDGGRTWTNVQSPSHATLLSVQFVSDDEGWIVGRGGTILRSGNGGRTWVEQESGTKQNLYGLFIDKKNGWAVGSNGLVLKYQR
jgi:photosystem II stability/assembly factor-like uncharacterized protein